MSVDLAFNSVWGGPLATSYLSVEDANTLALLLLDNPTAWDSCSEQKRKMALLRATQNLDSLMYIGEEYYTDQLLKWPRTLGHLWWTKFSDADSDENKFQTKSKFDIQAACFLEAYDILSSLGRTDHSDMSSQGVKQYSRSVGPIREQYTYGDPGGGSRISDPALVILRKYTRSRGLVRG